MRVSGQKISPDFHQFSFDSNISRLSSLSLENTQTDRQNGLQDLRENSAHCFQAEDQRPFSAKALYSVCSCDQTSDCRSAATGFHSAVTATDTRAQDN
jgi:hypothetical protein